MALGSPAAVLGQGIAVVAAWRPEAALGSARRQESVVPCVTDFTLAYNFTQRFHSLTINSRLITITNVIHMCYVAN